MALAAGRALLLRSRVATAAARAAGRAMLTPGHLSAPAMQTAVPSLLFSTAANDNNRHRSNSETLINEVPPIKVKGDVAMCDGGGGPLGHPLEYIQLNKVDPTEPSICGYCGLRFIRDPDHH